MRGLGILALIIAFFVLVWPYIARWLKRKAMDKAEDYLRASMGMPPRDKKASKERRRYSHPEENFSGHNGGFNHTYNKKEPIIPKDYAEDVEFIETVNYSETSVRVEKSKGEKIYHESQISDVEWTEIKKTRN